MKKLMLPAVLFAVVLFSNNAGAQVRFNVNVNLGRPAWGLPGDYDGDYYYLPEIDSYYDIPHRQFIYLSGGRWMIGAELPVVYRDYDLYRGYKVAINEPRPWYRGDYYRSRYNNYYMAYSRRPVIIDNRYRRYGRYEDDDDDHRWRGEEHGNNGWRGHGRWRENEDHDNDRGRGRWREHDDD